MKPMLNRGRVHAVVRLRPAAMTTRLGLVVSGFDFRRPPLVYPVFKPTCERENNQSEKSAEQRHSQAAQSDCYPNGRRHPHTGRRRQPLYVTLFTQLEDGAGPDKTDARHNALNDPREPVRRHADPRARQDEDGRAEGD